MINAPKEQKPFVDNLYDMLTIVSASVPVQVYRNLHKKCWSVRQNKKVRFHTNHILLKQINFKVSASGRARVLREQKKNVHAWVEGYLVHQLTVESNTSSVLWGEFQYNPYKNESFVDEDNRPLFEADYADMYCDKFNQSTLFYQKEKE